MSEEEQPFDPARLRKAWLKRLTDEYIKLESSMPMANFLPDKDCPKWVENLEREVGATVSEGDLVITLEAMKMYTAINAPGSGTITAIHVAVGDAVEEGQVLYTIG